MLLLLEWKGQTKGNIYNAVALDDGPTTQYDTKYSTIPNMSAFPFMRSKSVLIYGVDKLGCHKY